MLIQGNRDMKSCFNINFDEDLTEKNIGNIYYDKKGIIRRSENIYDKSKSLRKLNKGPLFRALF